MKLHILRDASVAHRAAGTVMCVTTTIVSVSTSSFAVAGADPATPGCPAAFAAFCESWDADPSWCSSPDGVMVVDMFAAGCETVFDEDTPAVVAGRNFIDDLAAQIADGWVVVVTTRHRERTRYVYWHAVAVTNAGVSACANSNDGGDLDEFCAAAATLGTYAPVVAMVG